MTRRRAGFAALGVTAYALALVATWPARFALRDSADFTVAGTIWNGEAVLDGAYRLEWRWAPWRSLANAAYAADVRLTGNGTDIAGGAARVPGGYAFEELSGRGDGALIAALVPSLAFTCDTSLVINLSRLRLSGATSSAAGEIRVDGGSCAARGASETVPLPPLIAGAARAPGDATSIVVAPVGQTRRHWLDGTIAGGRLVLTPTPDGVATLPLLAALRVDSAL